MTPEMPDGNTRLLMHVELAVKRARIAELEIQLKLAQETIANLRDYNDRAPKLAVEAENRRIAELEAQLLEASELLEPHIGHGVGILCVVDAVKMLEARLKEAEADRDGYHELLSVSQRGIIEVVEDALRREMVSDAYTAVHRLASEYRKAQAHVQNITVLNEEMNGRLGDLLEAYEETVAGNRALLHRAEKAEAENARLRGALEMIISRAWGCVPLVAKEVQHIAEAALRPAEAG